MKNNIDKIIYVGKAKNLKARVRSYFNQSSDKSVKTKYLVSQIHHIDYLLTNTEVEAFLLEASLIKKHRPRYNIRLKDDKSYPYIRVSVKDTYPRFYSVRRIKSDGSLYFGPYTSGYLVRETIQFLNKTFKIRDCADSYMKNRDRPCMTHQIGRCTAPCVDMITKRKYANDLKQALKFFSDTDQNVVKRLNRKMVAASRLERFELAAKLRDSINAVTSLWQRQSVVSQDMESDKDVVAFAGDERGTLVEVLHIRKGRVIGNRQQYFKGLNTAAESEDPKEWLTSFLNQYYAENLIPDQLVLSVDLGTDLIKLMQDVFEERQGKRTSVRVAMNEEDNRLMEMAKANARSHFKQKLERVEDKLIALKEIQKKFGLSGLPQRIECYDISHFQGKNSVGSQVVFEDGEAKKEDYRRYQIKTVKGIDDFASLAEVLERRLRHTEYEDPSLIVIDGGKGQLNTIVEILKNLGRSEIPLVGLAKARTESDFQGSRVEGSEERFFLPGRQNPVRFNPSSEAYRILVQIRNEAHRFAITYHRKLRDDEMLKSQLDGIKGLGFKRKKMLLQEFKTIDDIKAAGAEVIAKLPGFTKRVAEEIMLNLS